VYEAAIAEYRRSGMAVADVGAVTRAAGVARGTFYFHFPTKEHVLAELERGEEVRVAAGSAGSSPLRTTCGTRWKRSSGCS
jgi:AcrR family transcriptional regulator